MKVLKSLSSIACELDFAVLTVQDSAFIKEHVNFTFHVCCDIRYDEW
jgi:hypothetical protein